MKALVLDGSIKKDEISENLRRDLLEYLRVKKYEVNMRILREEKIAGCLGCFGCWLKTPGNCVIKDAGYDLPNEVIHSDVVFLLTPITFGMYSSELKKALDRFPCPVLLPFFKKVDGEIHHAPRYAKYPILVAVGSLPDEDKESEETFRTLVCRNAINLHTKAAASIIYAKDKHAEINEKLLETFSEVGI
jgi:multimeric flavodoxin WrbA